MASPMDATNGSTTTKTKARYSQTMCDAKEVATETSGEEQKNLRPDPASMVPQLEAHGVTYGDLETAIKVLNAVATLNPKNRRKRKPPAPTEDGSNEQPEDDSIVQYGQSNLRPFRKALAACLDLHQRTMFQGVAEEDHYEQRQQARSLKRQKMAERDLYQKHIATTALRKGRVDRLQAALNEGATAEETHKLRAIHAMMVPDGHVDTTTATTNDDPNAVRRLADHPVAVTLPCLRSCYVCKLRYRDLHAFYDQLCPACAAVNWDKRRQTARLTGRVAIVTGARVKIGYQVCVKLLRAGCTVVATTRFPNAAVDGYRREADFDVWKDQLHIYGLDLRDVAGLEAFTRFLKQQFAVTGVDVLINNACQTIRRPAGYYKPSIEKEQQLWSAADATHKERLNSCIEFERLRRRIVLDYKQSQQAIGGTSLSSAQLLSAPTPVAESVSVENGASSTTNGDVSCVVASAKVEPGVASTAATTVAPFETSGLAHSAAMSQMIILPEDAGVNADILPPGVSDINGQQLDLRATNSWLLKMEQVSTPELMECMFVNAIAPFVLNSRLKPLMTQPGDESRPDRYIINVSAMEGKVRL